MLFAITQTPPHFDYGGNEVLPQKLVIILISLVLFSACLFLAYRPWKKEVKMMPQLFGVISIIFLILPWPAMSALNVMWSHAETQVQPSEFVDFSYHVKIPYFLWGFGIPTILDIEVALP
jgi:cell division protein FtsW (lipid II flippase)